MKLMVSDGSAIALAATNVSDETFSTVKEGLVDLASGFVCTDQPESLHLAQLSNGRALLARAAAAL